MRTWADVAVLAKTKNLKGRFVARAAAGLPFLLEEGDEVAFVPPRLDVPRRAVVSLVKLVDERSAEVEFEGVDGDDAIALAGCHCLIRRDSIDESVFEEMPAAWEGWVVVDREEGEIGVVEGLVENPGQALLEVGRPDGGRVLVPVVDEIVRDVDAKRRIIGVELPQGLLDL